METHGIPVRLYRGLGSEDKRRVLAVARYAVSHLSRLKRRSGETYDHHGFEVAVALREMTDNPMLIGVAVLHDILVHPRGESLLAGAPLTTEQKQLIEVLYSLRRLQLDSSTADLDRFIGAFSNDIRLLPLRMAHRINDLRNIERFAPQLRRRIANETLHMYAPIAGRLGMHAWRQQMEEASFAFLQPTLVKRVAKRQREREQLDLACLRHTRTFLLRKLEEHSIHAEIDWRIKGLYSIYRKMVIKRRMFEELTDRLALRVIVEDIDACYRTLGIIHGHMHPIPGKLKDYIGAPKENGYRSIHTVVYPLPGVTEQPIEIQIRTRAMHEEGERGMANHEDYKNYTYVLHSQVTRVNLFRNLASLRHEVRSPEQFETALRTYFQEDHLALFDEYNNLYHLKKPVTALDFVCHVFGKRCLRLKSVRINGRAQPMFMQLRDGDTVEAKFGKTPCVRAEWLDACRHPATRRLLRDATRSKADQ